ncbi:helix-turn-helix transcriptional regulator [Polynucleobacter sphagniphilus]|uniref:helix-turn-helix transcriptional regulator n=1 Tax=Polynucleobacter sphagniphilus TaxID=1743169 RepID=UPI0024743A58|nr:AlpA family transcriptional regulator [Polynucleobacter sphagniphilus]MDH6249773.1 prophage regulatory protein [Polynucleobacter sphagniphilus]MDH6300004.1 prophage regulatory protein [Polynucleobacter sphagniphilus]
MTKEDKLLTLTVKQGRILRMRQLSEKLSLSDSHIYTLIQQNQFPKPFTLVHGGRAMGWYESDIDAWLAQRSGEIK